MRNYLFERFPPQTPAPSELKPESPFDESYLTQHSDHSPNFGKHHKGNPVPAFLTFFCLSILLTGLCVGLRLSGGGELLPSQVDAEQARPSSSPDHGSNFLDPPWTIGSESDLPETTIPRAPTGDGTVLTVVNQRGAELSASQIYEKALPSVVSVLAYSAEGVSSGSGIIMTENGYILTNFHIIDGCSRAQVNTLNDSRTFDANLVGYDEGLDIAVLKVDAEGLTPAEFGSSRALSVGDRAYALGNPMGYLNGSLSDGIISALSRNITVGGRDMTLIQTTAPLNSGNSGGALLNDSGQVVGVTSAKISSRSETTIEGLGLAIPISEVRGCINSILNCGEVITPRIGILCREAQVDGQIGILVESVEPDGSAAEAGMLPGDLITEAGGIPVMTVAELKDVFYDTGVGNKLTLTVYRSGLAVTLRVDILRADT